jgi:hypothetical protein
VATTGFERHPVASIKLLAIVAEIDTKEVSLFLEVSLLAKTGLGERRGEWILLQCDGQSAANLLADCLKLVAENQNCCQSLLPQPTVLSEKVLVLAIRSWLMKLCDVQVHSECHVRHRRIKLSLTLITHQPNKANERTTASHFPLERSFRQIQVAMQHFEENGAIRCSRVTDRNLRGNLTIHIHSNYTQHLQ